MIFNCRNDDDDDDDDSFGLGLELNEVTIMKGTRNNRINSRNKAACCFPVVQLLALKLFMILSSPVGPLPMVDDTKSIKWFHCYHYFIDLHAPTLRSEQALEPTHQRFNLQARLDKESRLSRKRDQPGIAMIKKEGGLGRGFDASWYFISVP